MSVPSEVYGLVERFDRNREEYRSGRFNETQAQVDFIDPLMGLLGWDDHNQQGRRGLYFTSWRELRNLRRGRGYRTLAPTPIVVLSIKERVAKYVTSPIKRCQRK